VWSLVLWAAYAGLLVARWRLGWYGRRFALGVVGIFAFLVLTFWGTNLLSGIHQRPPPPAS
jgi:ABC-type transport system involved in cytochrome c biogenesis permease subunit